MTYGDNYGNGEQSPPLEADALDHEDLAVRAMLAIIDLGDSFVIRRDRTGMYDLVLRQWYDRTASDGTTHAAMRATRGTGPTIPVALAALVRNLEGDRWRNL